MIKYRVRGCLPAGASNTYGVTELPFLSTLYFISSFEFGVNIVLGISHINTSLPVSNSITSPSNKDPLPKHPNTLRHSAVRCPSLVANVLHGSEIN